MPGNELLFRSLYAVPLARLSTEVDYLLLCTLNARKVAVLYWVLAAAIQHKSSHSHRTTYMKFIPLTTLTTGCLTVDFFTRCWSL